MPCTHNQFGDTSGDNNTQQVEVLCGNLDNDELPEDIGASERDEIGIVCAICMKLSRYTSFI